MIETAVDPLDRSVPTGVPPVGPACEANWTVAKSIGVDACTRRIFQALTLPEYLEAWIEMPDQTADSFVVASQDANGYRLSHCFAGRTAVSIASSYLFCHLRKMRMLWRKTRGPICAESVVDFRLRGNFGSSILELRHTELDSAEEFFWYQRLWQGSLKKLASLLRSA
ncbi:MAG: hypothetical protein WCF30_20290 [Terracidiphilus sp.]